MASRLRGTSKKSASDSDIMAFRTMTTIISLIQRTDPSLKAPELSPPSPTDEQSRELRVLSALATILVMEHEKVAVVAKHGNSSGGGVEVFACTDSSAGKNTKSDSESSYADIFQYLWNFVVAENPRENPQDDDSEYPAIHNPRDSPDHLCLQGISENELLGKLLADVKKYW